MPPPLAAAIILRHVGTRAAELLVCVALNKSLNFSEAQGLCL